MANTTRSNATRRSVQVGAGFTAAVFLLLGFAASTCRADEGSAAVLDGASGMPGLQQPVTTPAAPVHKTRVAVVPFSSTDGKPFSSCSVKVAPMRDAGRKLGDEISERIAVWPEYEVVSASVVGDAIRKYRLDRKGIQKPASLRLLAQATGADMVVIGQTEGTTWSGKGHEGASLYASIEIVSVTDAKVLWSVDGCVQDTKSASKVVPTLADDMVRQLYAKIQEADGKPLLAMAVVTP